MLTAKQKLVMNIESRKSAEAFIGFAEEEATRLASKVPTTKDAQWCINRFLEEMGRGIAAKLGMVMEKPTDSRLQPMTDQEAIDFEKEKMPYGSCKGIPVGELVLSYLTNFDENAFTRQMRRYLRSSRFKERQE